MKTFKISCSWEVYATGYVEAESLKEAIKKAEGHDYPLPTDADYIDDSFVVDHDMTKELNEI